MRVVVGISGGIAAYKSAYVIRGLVEAGHDVNVVPTRSALQFIGLPTLEALSRNPVTADVFDDVAEVRHVALGQQADVIVIAPATANTLAKLATGAADDLLGTTVLASRAPLVVAPAMHTEMWQHPATQANVATLRERGVTIVGPASGRLTGDDSGIGRMEEPAAIVAAALAAAAPSPGPLSGVRIVISAGGTREPIDPVRFLGNRSSGAHGAALAAAAAGRGADVTLVGANLQVAPPAGVRVVPVSTAAELRDAMLAEADADVVVMAAAVADYRVADVSDAKLKKASLGDAPTLQLAENPDILAELAGLPDRGIVVGFAAETETDDRERIAIGQAKLARKRCDLLVVNRVGFDAGFGDVETQVDVLDASGVVASAAGTKMSVAAAILDVIQNRIQERA